MTVESRVWINKSAVVTSAEIAGLQAVLSQNAADKKQAKANAKNILRLLKGAKVIPKEVLAQLKGLWTKDSPKRSISSCTATRTR